MVGFTLRNTLSEFGTVARGVCDRSADGFLESVTEMTKIERDGSGAKAIGPDGKLLHLTGDETVSMNLWGFTPALFNDLRQLFSEFLAKHGAEEKSNFTFLPPSMN